MRAREVADRATERAARADEREQVRLYAEARLGEAAALQADT